MIEKRERERRGGNESEIGFLQSNSPNGNYCLFFFFLGGSGGGDGGGGGRAREEAMLR